MSAASSRQASGHRRWVFADGYTAADLLPHEIPSHETLCFTNLGSRAADVEVTVLFEHDRPPLALSSIRIEPMRSYHLRTDLVRKDGIDAMPRGVPVSYRVESTERIVAMYSRLNWIGGYPTTLAVSGYGEDEGPWR